MLCSALFWTLDHTRRQIDGKKPGDVIEFWPPVICKLTLAVEHLFLVRRIKSFFIGIVLEQMSVASPIY
jgi:hypothetical protein